MNEIHKTMLINNLLRGVSDVNSQFAPQLLVMNFVRDLTATFKFRTNNASGHIIEYSVELSLSETLSDEITVLTKCWLKYTNITTKTTRYIVCYDTSVARKEFSALSEDQKITTGDLSGIFAYHTVSIHSFVRTSNLTSLFRNLHIIAVGE